MNTFIVYLIGYGNQIANEFFERLETVVGQCLLLDIRARRTSWCRQYIGAALETAAKGRGHDYLWLPQLGAANGHRGDQVHLVDEPIGMMALEAQLRKSKLPVVLLCAERRSNNCHRSVVARRMAARLRQKGLRCEIRPIL